MTSDPHLTRPNLQWWDERAAFHRDTPLYQRHITRLQQGGVALLPLDVEALGDLNGLKVLHLQCHIGTDTLSLARLGADVTGVDFSPVAIAEARKLSNDLGIPATFLTCELDALPPHFASAFDLVFTSHGVLSWLPDLHAWARHAAACVAPGGQLYLSESHPLIWALAEQGAVMEDALKLGHTYLASGQPLTFEEPGSYADRASPTTHNQTVEWSWGLGDVVNAVLASGLQLVSLHEHPLGFFPYTEDFIERPDGHTQLPPPLHGRFPLTFSLRARRS